MEIILFGLTRVRDMIVLLLDFICSGEEAFATFCDNAVDIEGPPLGTVLLGPNLRCAYFKVCSDKHLKSFLLY